MAESKNIENVMTDLGLTNDEKQQIITNEAKGTNVQVLDADVQMYKEHLKLLIARGKTKEFLGKTITYADLDRMSVKELEKTYKLYETAQASKINQAVTNTVINAYTQICGMIIKPEPT